MDDPDSERTAVRRAVVLCAVIFVLGVWSLLTSESGTGLAASALLIVASSVGLVVWIRRLGTQHAAQGESVLAVAGPSRARPPTRRTDLPIIDAVSGHREHDDAVADEGEHAYRCAKCGRPIDRSGATWTPPAPGELCSWCVSGHGPGWVEYPEADWWLPRMLLRSRFTRWIVPRSHD